MIASFPYRAPDSTQLLNFIAKDILPKGVYVYPTNENMEPIFVVPGSGNYEVSISKGWVVRNHDGMTIREEDVDHPIILTGSVAQYVGLESQYVLSAEPSMELKSILVTEYNTYTQSQKDAFVIFAKVTPPAGGTILDGSISMDYIELPRGPLALSADVENMKQSVVRTVTSNAALTTLTNPVTNEISYVSNEKSFYVYTNSSWSVVGRPLTGTSAFAGSAASPKTITVSGLPTAGYVVTITPTADSSGQLGNFWVKTYSTYFEVWNDGIWGGAGATFDWAVLSK